MRKFIIFAALSAAMLVSCKKEEQPSEPQGELVTTTVQATLSSTKVAENGTKLLWSEGDKIAVFDGSGMREFTLKTGAGSATATFSGQMMSDATSLKAIYPYSAARKNGSFFVPLSQSIASGATVDSKALVCTAPATAVGKTLTCTAAVALVRIVAPDKTTSCTATFGSKVVVCTLPGTSGSFDIPVETGEYEGYNISLLVDSKTISVKSTETLVLSANTVKEFNAFETGIHGTITYSDGKAAAGITVSDGFNVVVTDSEGKYKLEPSTDVRYIYFSYPSDAAITTVTNGYPGCPDFFKKYDAATKEYNFTITRQEVESEFMLFAMADPQAHYAARGTQKSSDVARFKAEAVPDINNKIKEAGIPCYGVTLGDVVYSEGSRNSNGGMATMRSHFNAINMPVFQTMGNHDFTYFYTSTPLKTDETSSTLFLAAQRKFEDCFGPVNLSFNRGDVHIVCMRNIIFDSTTDASDYHGGFSNDQWNWLKADLANVPKDKMVILCVHDPMSYIVGQENVNSVLSLMKQYKNSTIFSGHTHYYRGVENVGGSGMFEHIHSAICGQWWWSKIEGDGCPNGYTMYRIKGNEIKNARFTGFNDTMNVPGYQMRIYKGDLTTGGKYAYFQWYLDNKSYFINVFNGDSRWKVRVYENGVYAGEATLMSNSKKTFSSVTKGQTYLVPSPSNQDWWAIGYHIGFCQRGTTSTSYYTNMFHMWKWVASSADAAIKVEATDPYGNVYTCEDVVATSTYPEYIKIPLTIF